MKSLFSRLITSYKRLQLRNKLFVSYLLLISVPLALFSFILYESISAKLVSDTTYAAQKSIDQTYEFLSSKLEKVIRTSDIAMSSDLVQSIYGMNPSDVPENIDRLLILGKAKQSLDGLRDEDVVAGVQLYVSKGSPFYGTGYFFPAYEDAKLTNWYARLQTTLDRMYWSPGADMSPTDFEDGGVRNGDMLSMFRTIRNHADLTSDVGVIRVDLRANELKRILSNAVTFKDGVAFIRNEREQAVLVSEQALFDSVKPALSNLVSPTDAEHIQLREVNGQKVFFYSKPFPRTDWSLSIVLPYRSVVGEAVSLRNEMYVLIAAITTAAFLFAYLLANTMTKRLTSLSVNMKKAQMGNLIKLDVSGDDQDEIGKLARNFNAMVGKISTLVEERFNDGIQVKNAELKALQAQINPHFLYNSLDMINWLAQANRTSDIETAINALALFYRFSLNEGRDEVSVHDELEHIRHYVTIQNMRFENKLSLVVEVDEAVQEFSILKLTLQPLVENAILHGIMKKVSREGTIFIEGAFHEGDIVLSVHDDGVGIPEGRWPMRGDSMVDGKRKGGYGVRNVQMRCRLIYGPTYGLSYRSKPGEGTTVDVRIPSKPLE